MGIQNIRKHLQESGMQSASTSVSAMHAWSVVPRTMSTRTEEFMYIVYFISDIHLLEYILLILKRASAREV